MQHPGGNAKYCRIALALPQLLAIFAGRDWKPTPENRALQSSAEKDHWLCPGGEPQNRPLWKTLDLLQREAGYVPHTPVAAHRPIETTI